MNYYEKIGQLFVVTTRSDAEANPEFIDSLICNYNIGGLMFLKGTPMKQAEFTNHYQHLSKIPLLITIDGEWGVSMRLDSTIRFPRQMTLGAMADDTLIYDMGKEIARQFKRLGIHVNYAPDIDINNNAANPVINSRSFGENKNEVARKGFLYMKGLQDNGILACGKHFPGHGNTDTDSHFALPIINQTVEELDTMELVPFQFLINNGLGSVMVAHLFIPSLDTTANQPSTLSKAIVTDLLKEKLNFKGIVFTDALNMKGASIAYNPGTLEVKSLQAGNDVLLYSENIPAAAEQIHYAIQNCDLDQNDINEKVKKMLQVKFWCGLNHYNAIDYTNLYNDLNTSEAQWLNYRLYRNSITMLANKNNLLPLGDVAGKKVASVVINDTLDNPFQQMLNRYMHVDEFRMEKEPPDRTFDSLFTELKKYEYIILSIHNTSTKANLDFGISDQTNQLIKELSGKAKLAVVLFGNSYCLGRIPDAINADALVISYEDTHLPQILTAQLLFGASDADGSLPVSITSDFYRGSGTNFKNLKLRFKYAPPQEEKFSANELSKIDSIVNDGIFSHAFPGCQVLVAHDGTVVYEKAFGFKTYDSTEIVKEDDLYDIASVTKIAATALATMKLYEEEKINLSQKASKYFSKLKKTNKKNCTLLDILTHQAGLQSWIPFYKKTIANGQPFHHIYHREPGEEFSVRVADSLYIKNDYQDVIWKEIFDSPLGEKGKYVYSDLGPLIMGHIIEKITKKKLDEYVEENFYQPLGLTNVTSRPHEKKTDLRKIVPTANDTVFRKQLLRGDVHDPAAAMLGGVAGNAGIFSDANSLAVIMQMLLQGGEYGGKRYFKKETVEYFTKRQFPLTSNRRGLLFDKPEPGIAANGPTCGSASMSTFGHQGFTGTCAWADPLNKIVYIFLSNRVYPDETNTKLAAMNIRTKIMQVIYDARK
ncbi:MAG TPA: glycoside hydrolase family 3 N-terminal domain-containing protein [Bacteroidia bacterium]|nr:glycoside hydrolase family 3 N-terminal domain-containing protein [Bacteroidia bacterium]